MFTSLIYSGTHRYNGFIRHSDRVNLQDALQHGYCTIADGTMTLSRIDTDESGTIRDIITIILEAK